MAKQQAPARRTAQRETDRRRGKGTVQPRAIRHSTAARGRRD